jgi:glycosyltransferase involved in cell wall biosynthesis
MPQISVIIPTYNREQFIGEAIKSVVDQTYPPLEIIVVDDGSTDQTAEVIRRFKSPIPVFYHWQPNQGHASALNLGVSFARGDWIAFLDSDDVWYPHKLAVLTNYIQTVPDVPFLYSDLDYFRVDETGQHKLTEREWNSDLIPLIFQGGPNASPSAVLLRKDVFMEAGGFNPSLRIGVSWDFFARVAHTWPIYHIPESLAKQRLHPGQTTRNLETRAGNYHRFHACMWELWRDEPGKRAILLREAIKIYESLGKHFLRRQNYQLARQCFRRAYCYMPCSWRNLRRCVFSSVPGLQQLYRYSCKVKG